MRKTLGAIGLLLLLAAGVVVNSLTPTPSVKAREAVWDAFETKANKNEPLAKVYWKGFNPIGYEKIPFNVLLIPSLGREASDFNELANGLNDDGNRVFLFDPRGLHGEPLPDSPTLEHFAEPITDINWENNPFPTVLIGHAFGNRVARMAASKNPNDITAVILLAAGGQTPMPPKAEQSLKNIFNPLRTYRSRMKDMHYAFFAEGNDIPDYWTRGWHTKTAMAQAKAVANSADDESWHCAGGVPILKMPMCCAINARKRSRLLRFNMQAMPYSPNNLKPLPKRCLTSSPNIILYP